MANNKKDYPRLADKIVDSIGGANNVSLCVTCFTRLRFNLVDDGLAQLDGIKLMFPVEANAVFADIPVPVQAALRARGWQFYTFLGATGCRLMCAWDTAPATVDRFLADAEAADGV